MTRNGNIAIEQVEKEYADALVEMQAALKEADSLPPLKECKAPEFPLAFLKNDRAIARGLRALIYGQLAAIAYTRSAQAKMRVTAARVAGGIVAIAGILYAIIDKWDWIWGRLQ